MEDELAVHISPQTQPRLQGGHQCVRPGAEGRRVPHALAVGEHHRRGPPRSCPALARVHGHRQPFGGPVTAEGLQTLLRHLGGDVRLEIAARRHDGIGGRRCHGVPGNGFHLLAENPETDDALGDTIQLCHRRGVAAPMDGGGHHVPPPSPRLPAQVQGEGLHPQACAGLRECGEVRPGVNGDVDLEGNHRPHTPLTGEPGRPLVRLASHRLGDLLIREALGHRDGHGDQQRVHRFLQDTPARGDAVQRALGVLGGQHDAGELPQFLHPLQGLLRQGLAVPLGQRADVGQEVGGEHGGVSLRGCAASP